MTLLALWLLASFATWRIAHTLYNDLPIVFAMAVVRFIQPTVAGVVVVGVSWAGYDLPLPALVWLAVWGGASFLAIAVE